METLPKEELEIFDKYRKTYLANCNMRYKYKDKMADVSTLLTTWSNRKQNLYKLLNNSFQYRVKDFSIEKDIETISSAIRNDHAFYNLTSYITNLYAENETDLIFTNKKIIEESPYYSNDTVIHWFVQRLLADSGVIKQGKFYSSIPISITRKSTATTIEIQKDCKYLKVLKTLLKLFPEKEDEYKDLLLAFQKHYALCVNDKFIKGDLVLSIHPMDFATMSMNSYNWRSCMHWGSGEYRLGTVEMMNSSNVLVAYLEGEEPYHDSSADVTWTNKKWRELFIVDEKLIAAIKGYPYNNNEECVKRILTILKDLASKNLSWEYEDEIKSLLLDGRNNRDAGPNITTITNAMYNDCYFSHFVYLAKNLDYTSSFKLTYGKEITCMNCGRTIEEEFEWGDYPNSIALDCCCSFEGERDYYTCVHCGWESEYEDDFYYSSNLGYLCEVCHQEVSICDCCGRDVYDVTQICINKEEKCYAKLCERCVDTHTDCGTAGKSFSIHLEEGEWTFNWIDKDTRFGKRFQLYVPQALYDKYTEVKEGL